MSNTKEVLVVDQVDASTNIDPSVTYLEPHIPPPIPDPTGIALLLFAIIGISELGRATISSKS